MESLEETIFRLEREVERLRSGTEPDGADISGDEMAALMRERGLREDTPG